MTDRPTPPEPIGGWQQWRRDWPPGGRVAYLTTNLNREEIARRLLTSDDVAQLVDDPWRELDNSARLKKRELAALLVALSTPRNPLP